MKKILLVIDVQNGFTRTPKTVETAKKIEQLVEEKTFDYVLATKFINQKKSPYDRFMNWQELKTEKEQELFGNLENIVDKVIPKYIYTCIDSSFIEKIKKQNDDNVPTEIYLCGLDTDCCVLKIATDLFEQGIRPIVLSEYCNSNGGKEAHNAGIKCMERLIGKHQIVKIQI
ncbi:MAG: isochorismatase family protein [Bacilli bacterium]|nr:isochorismatase family protein [Bacilli bacterium]